MSELSSKPGDNAKAFLAVSQPRFSLGQVVATPGALALLTRHGVAPGTLLSRHVSGDWGQLSVDDARANEDAVKFGDRVLSAYALPVAPTGGTGKNGKTGAADKDSNDEAATGDRVWVITEADRSSTCLLLPSEY